MENIFHYAYSHFKLLIMLKITYWILLFLKTLEHYKMIKFKCASKNGLILKSQHMVVKPVVLMCGPGTCWMCKYQDTPQIH